LLLGVPFLCSVLYFPAGKLGKTGKFDQITKNHADEGGSMPPATQIFFLSGLNDIMRRKGLLLEFVSVSPHESVLPVAYEGYRSLYMTNAPDPLFIEKIKPTYVWKGESSYQNLVGNEKFDIVIVSHVIERVPNLIAFLNGITDILTLEGEIRLAFPDYRYCSDWSRQPSRLADIIGAYVEDRTKPSFADVYDYIGITHTGGVRNNPEEHWSTSPAERAQQMVRVPDPMWHSQALSSAYLAREQYTDIHVWRFDSQTFSEYMNFLTNTGLLRLALVSLIPAQQNSYEVLATLKLCSTS